MRMLGEMAAEDPRARLSVKQTENVPRHLVEPRALGKLPHDIGCEAVEHVEPRRRSVRLAKQNAIDFRQKIRIRICGTAEHDAVHLRQMRFRGGE